MRNYNCEIWFEAANETRPALIQALGDMMSDISETAMSAAWLDRLEDDLPRICYATLEANAVIDDGWLGGIITPDLARVLVGIAEILGHWVTFNMEPPRPHRPDYVPYETPNTTA